jgi:hypothetical protein
MSIRYRFVLVIATAIGAAGCTACYTLTQHPRLASLDYARPKGTPCTKCHTNEETWAFGHPPMRATYASYSRAWTAYYDTPWWYGKRWDYHPHSEESRHDTGKTTENEQ